MMPIAHPVDGADCTECGADELFYDVKEEPSVYKVGARCHGCERDYGVLDRIQRSDIDHIDEVYERAEASVRGYFEGDE